MTLIFPEATPVQGNIKVKAVLTVADSTAPKLATEINAAGSLDVSLFLRDWNPDLTTNTGSAPPRLGSGVQLPVEGNTQFAAIELRYPYDPQAASTTNDNKALAMFTRGVELFFVVRKGLDAQTDAFAVADHVETWKLRCGKQRKLRSGDDEFSEFEVVQNFFPLAEPVDGIVAT